MYQVEFAGGKVTELTTNVIAQSMYTQCDADGNAHLPLDVLVDNCKDNKAISLRHQQILVWGRSVTHKTTAGWQICSGRMILLHGRCYPSQTNLIWC